MLPVARRVLSVVQPVSPSQTHQYFASIGMRADSHTPAAPYAAQQRYLNRRYAEDPVFRAQRLAYSKSYRQQRDWEDGNWREQVKATRRQRYLNEAVAGLLRWARAFVERTRGLMLFGAPCNGRCVKAAQVLAWPQAIRVHRPGLRRLRNSVATPVAVKVPRG